MSTRRQSHCVANRNARNAAARATLQPPVNVSSATSEDTNVFELGGRLTLVQERDIEWRVPALFAERDAPDLDRINNPVNQLGALHSYEVPIVTSNDPVSYASAVNKRSNFMQTGPDDDVSDECLQASLAMVAKLPRLFDTWDENEADREKWLSKFDKGKRSRMEVAWLELDRCTLKDLTSKTGSTKVEVLTGKRFDKDAAGRIIYAGTDAFNAVTGPPQMVAMSRLKELLDHEVDGKRTTVGPVEVMLGYQANDHQLAGFIVDDRFKEIVEGDFSRNDREQRKRVAVIIDAWFEAIGMPPWYRDLMFKMEHYTLTNHAFGLQVKLCYQLATGTTNTTFRNSCYNITMFALACQLQNRRGRALVLGDDLLAALNKRLRLSDWVKLVADFKMVLKAKAPELNGEATFLSRRIFAETETPFMLPLLGKMLVRFNCRANQNPAISDSRAMAAKALSYAFGCKNVHVLRDVFLRRFEMEDDGAQVSVDDLGWQVRSLGHTTADVKRLTEEAENLVDYDTFAEWCYTVYELDYEEVMELFHQTILCVDPIMLENPNIQLMAKDYQ